MSTSYQLVNRARFGQAGSSIGSETGDSVSQDNSTEESPDVGFRLERNTAAEGIGLVPGRPARSDRSAEQDRLIQQVTDELLAQLPDGWDRLDVAVAMTVSDETAQVIVSDSKRAAPARLSMRMVELLRELRHRSAESADGPWWRFLAIATRAGSTQIEYDYGAEPFPDQQLFPPQAYLADLRTYPRKRLPMWLAAYVGHGGRQTRTPGIAAHAEAGDGPFTPRVETDLPALPLLWARWAVIAAAFVAADSPLGPRTTTALGWFEGSTRSGSTLHLLPHGRAVLSGGLWSDLRLDATYNDGATMPQLYRGAPDWVADPVLNPRAANGLLSFCYWWDGEAWLCGESPVTAELSPALPGIWSSDTVFDVLAQLIEGSSSSWITALVAAAETGSVTRALLARSLAGDKFDLDAGYYQLMLAGIAK
ncbi:hypothetical protein OHB26_06825 [Nocardia sp. NBC_01503]|uniref:hypothetical protein n=1 Tax=Nocardia sp. NBC_01503 TaxID=2975997 RepID=UPI002E7C2436|nr:hypothetical protein [Nocardia sp. NBC_01503]WTL33923.1 hypothetical protein OHB26_06825 [Nocardia sp. NBC_01503]